MSCDCDICLTGKMVRAFTAKYEMNKADTDFLLNTLPACWEDSEIRMVNFSELQAKDKRIEELENKLLRYNQAPKIPFIKGGHCQTTHSACDCVLDNLTKLRAKCNRLEEALEELYCQAATIIGECEDFASACEGGDSVQIFDICQNWLTEFGERKKQALKGE